MSFTSQNRINFKFNEILSGETRYINFDSVFVIYPVNKQTYLPFPVTMQTDSMVLTLYKNGVWDTASVLYQAHLEKNCSDWNIVVKSSRLSFHTFDSFNVTVNNEF